jgi:hypothetical protein
LSRVRRTTHVTGTQSGTDDGTCSEPGNVNLIAVSYFRPTQLQDGRLRSTRHSMCSSVLHSPNTIRQYVYVYIRCCDPIEETISVIIAISVRTCWALSCRRDESSASALSSMGFFGYGCAAACTSYVRPCTMFAPPLCGTLAGGCHMGSFYVCCVHGPRVIIWRNLIIYRKTTTCQ